MYKQKYKEGQQIHKDIYLYICRYIKEHRYAPSYKEIADGVGVSNATVLRHMDISAKPDWCPLRPLPEKFDNEKDRKLGDFEPLLKIGWNACIDAFAGGNIDD